MLSIVSLAHTSKVVPYATIKAALGMDNVRHLEDIIFDTIYSGLLQGKLDQRQGVLKVRSDASAMSAGLTTLSYTLRCNNNHFLCRW